jgi:hypothetical protein
LIQVVSVSLGSPSRDHAVEVDMLGTRVSIRRRGTGGDFPAFLRAFRELDGTVDAFGVGGAEFHMEVDGRRYAWRQLRAVREAVTRSKLADGNGVKHILEPMAVRMLGERVDLRGKRAVCMAAVDRYGLARALVDAGCDARFGDLGSIGLPVTLPSLGYVHALARVIMPVLTQLPFSVVYPVGDDDKPVAARLRRACAEADVVAGDFLQVAPNLPDDLTGKIVVTNTTTAADVDDLRRRGLRWLVTTTPRLNGRSFGTNVMEAVCRALCDKPDAEIGEADLREMLARIPIRPEVHDLA